MRSADFIVVDWASQPIKVAYRSYGAGRPLFFIHGWNHSGEIWESVVDQIGSQYRCVLVDIPGFGASPPMPIRNISIKAYAEVCALVCAKLLGESEQLAVVGDSFGGLVALGMLNEERVEARFLLISGCPAEGLSTAFRAMAWLRVPLLGMTMLQNIPRSISRPILRALTLSTVHRWSDVKDSIIDGVLQADPQTSQAVFEAMLKLSDDSTRKPTTLRKAVVVRGEFDRVASRASSLRLAQRLMAEFREIPGVGHTPMVENPSVYAEAIISLTR